MKKQTFLANKFHTCTCKDECMGFDNKNMTFVDADFERADKEAPKGRIIWFTCPCLTCGGVILRGVSYANYRTRCKELIREAVNEAVRWANQDKKSITKKLTVLFDEQNRGVGNGKNL